MFEIILLALVVLIYLPFMTALVDIISAYEKYIGSYARSIINKGSCM